MLLFSLDFITLVMNCVRGVHFNLFLNGSIYGSFSPERGLQQGNPMLPLLFILSVEFFSRLVQAEEVVGICCL